MGFTTQYGAGFTFRNRNNLQDALYIPLSDNLTFDLLIHEKFNKIVESYKIKKFFIIKKHTEKDGTFYISKYGCERTTYKLEEVRLYHKVGNAKARCNKLNNKTTQYDSYKWEVEEIGLYYFNIRN